MEQALAKVLYVCFLIATLHQVEIIVLIVWDGETSKFHQVAYCYEGRKRQGVGSDIWQPEHSQVTRTPGLRSARESLRSLALQPAKDSKEFLSSPYCASWGKGSITNGGLGRKINLDSAN